MKSVEKQLRTNQPTNDAIRTLYAKNAWVPQYWLLGSQLADVVDNQVRQFLLARKVS